MYQVHREARIKNQVEPESWDSRSASAKVRHIHDNNLTHKRSLILKFPGHFKYIMYIITW